MLDAFHALISKVSDLIAQGAPPWRKPWSASHTPSAPLRADGRCFTGANAWTLALAAAEAGFEAPYWLTYRQALALDAPVRRGARGAPALMFRALDAEGGEGEGTEPLGRRRGYLRAYTVFNAEQLIDPPERLLAPLAALSSEGQHRALAAVPATIILSDRPAYHPVRDVVLMPPEGCFDSMADYHATLGHELAHWTGAPTRLGRAFGRRFGDQAYAFEELVAELASMLLGLRLGLAPPPLESHAAYLGAWVQVLADRPFALVEASGHAQRAVDLLVSFSDGPASQAGEASAP